MDTRSGWAWQNRREKPESCLYHCWLPVCLGYSSPGQTHVDWVLGPELVAEGQAEPTVMGGYAPVSANCCTADTGATGSEQLVTWPF